MLRMDREKVGMVRGFVRLFLTTDMLTAGPSLPSSGYSSFLRSPTERKTTHFCCSFAQQT